MLSRTERRELDPCVVSRDRSAKEGKKRSWARVSNDKKIDIDGVRYVARREG